MHCMPGPYCACTCTVAHTSTCNRRSCVQVLLVNPQTSSHAGVCDDPDYFYNFVDGLLEDLGASSSVGSSSSGRGSSGSSSPGGSPGAAASPGGGGLGARGGAVGGGVAARALLRAVQARGAGYAISTDEELRTVKVCAPVLNPR